MNRKYNDCNGKDPKGMAHGHSNKFHIHIRPPQSDIYTVVHKPVFGIITKSAERLATEHTTK